MKISLIILLIAKLSLVAGCRLPGEVTPSNGVRETEQGGTQAQPQGVSTGRAPHDMTNLAALAARNQTKPASDMALIPGGTFLMGTGHGLAAEGPVHAVRLRSFLIDKCLVTVGQFAAFVAATGYRTTAERLGWSGVFDLRAGKWQQVSGADWRHPDGPATAAPMNEPVTQVSWDDAAAYVSWANKRLPTEAEFEYAARGGLQAKAYGWGNDWRPGGKYMTNCWQGNFPAINTAEDGFIGRAPVAAFPANGYGLYDMTGNVWEWCADWFDATYYQKSQPADPPGPVCGPDRVIRGGSWLCSDNFCRGFRVAARNHAAPDTGLNNIGFRCVLDVSFAATGQAGSTRAEKKTARE